MAILDELKALIKERGGSTIDIHTIAEAVRVLTELEKSED